MSTGTLNGANVTSAEVWIPHTGLWHALVHLDTAVAVPATPRGATLVLGGLTLVGTAVIGATWHGAAAYRLVGGAGGWRWPVAARSYQADVGVRRSLVLADAAREVGESVTFEAGADGIIGTAFARRAAPAGRVLEQLAGVWWCDAAGVTHVGPRPTGAVTSPFSVVRVAAENGCATVATERPEDFTPGRTVDVGTGEAWTIATVKHVLDTRLRTDLWRAVS